MDALTNEEEALRVLFYTEREQVGLTVALAKKGGKMQCRWQEAESNPLYGRGFEGRRWILRKNGVKKEEVSIEDGDPDDPGLNYEIVGHDFKSGDVEGIEYAKTLGQARKEVKRFIKKNPCGQYE